MQAQRVMMSKRAGGRITCQRALPDRGHAYHLHSPHRMRYSSELPLYKYELSIYKYELSIYKYELSIYKYELQIYKYELSIYK